MATKVHKVTLIVVDHDDLGGAQVGSVLELASYPNNCVSPSVVRVETKEVEWSDDHPLNKRGTNRLAFFDALDARCATVLECGGRCILFAPHDGKQCTCAGDAPGEPGSCPA